jgi:hypothetical protein
MDDESGGKVVTTRDACLARRASTEAAALLQQTGAGGPMNRSVDAPTTEQRAVCGIHDGVNRKLRDVASYHSHARCGSHFYDPNSCGETRPRGA